MCTRAVGKIGSRAAAACAITSITITTKISAPGRLQIVDFPPPALLVYETHNEGRLGNMGGGGPNEMFLEISNADRSKSVLLKRAAASICMSTWMLAAEPCRTYNGKEPKSEESAHTASKS